MAKKGQVNGRAIEQTWENASFLHAAPTLQWRPRGALADALHAAINYLLVFADLFPILSTILDGT